MKVSYVEGVANHNGPESCGAAREGGVEALAGGRAGRVWSREIHALLRKQQVLRDAVGTGRSHVCLWLRELQAASGSRRTYGDEERTGEVGRFHRTSEIAEQSRGTGSGGDGGEGTGQGKLARVQRAPDSGPGWRAQRARAGT